MSPHSCPLKECWKKVVKKVKTYLPGSLLALPHSKSYQFNKLNGIKPPFKQVGNNRSGRGNEKRSRCLIFHYSYILALWLSFSTLSFHLLMLGSSSAFEDLSCKELTSDLILWFPWEGSLLEKSLFEKSAISQISDYSLEMWVCESAFKTSVMTW